MIGMEREETNLQRHYRIVLEDEQRAKYREAADQGFGLIGALTDGWGALLHGFKRRPLFGLLLAAVVIGVASLLLTGSVMIAADLIAVAGVWWAISAYRKRRAGRSLSSRQNTRS